MKSMVAVLMFAALAANAQTPPQQLPGPGPVVTPAPSLDLFPIGHSFGAGGAYQVGFDKVSLVGGCVERELHDGQWLAGPCRNVIVMEKNGVEVAHVTASIMYNAEHGNASYCLGLGIKFGPVVKAAVDKAASEIPALDSLAAAIDQQPLPPFLNQLNNMTGLDFVGGYRPVHTPDVIGDWTYGIMGHLTFTVAQAEALLPTPFGTQPNL